MNASPSNGGRPSISRMCLIQFFITALFSAGCLAQGGSPKESAPTSAPALSTQPAGKPSSGNTKVDAILDRLEVKGRAIKGLSCKLIYQFVTVMPVEDRQTKEGELLFARGEPNSRFYIHFKKLIADGIVKETGEYWSFDGQWLVERNDLTKKIIKREVAKPGERQDPFKIGKGPFPLPFGQKREDILSNFKVTLADFTLGDPRNSDHLHCVPVPNTPLADKYSRVEIYVDRTLELPVRVVSERLSDSNRIEVDFKDIDLQEAPAGSRFRVEEPKDYDVTVEPLSPEITP